MGFTLEFFIYHLLFSKPGLSSCEPCPEGFYCSLGQMLPCPKGSFCPMGTGMNSSLCPPGTYGNRDGLSEVSFIAFSKPCLAGSFCYLPTWSKCFHRPYLGIRFFHITLSLNQRNLNAPLVTADPSVNPSG